MAGQLAGILDMGPELQGLTHKATAYWSSCIIEAALRLADIGRHSLLFLRVYTLTCPLDHSSNNQTQVWMINIWIIYLIAAFWLIVYMIIFVTDNTLFCLSPLSSWVMYASLKLTGWQAFISNRLQTVRLFAIWIIKVTHWMEHASQYDLTGGAFSIWGNT